MKKILLGSVGLVVVLGAALAIVPSLIPSSVYKAKIESQLSSELGRDVKVLGDVKLSVFPTIKANTGRVEIANPDGFSTEQFASMDAMSVRVKLFPLFAKRVEIKSFTLKNPAINLEKAADGTVNWAFADDAEELPAQEDTGPFKRDGRYAALDPSIGKFTLENGQISYIDNMAGSEQKLEEVNFDFVLTGLSDPLAIEGAFVFNGTPVDIDLTVESLRNFLDGKESAVGAKLTTDFAKVDADGRFLPGEDIAFNLDIDGSASDVKSLLALVPGEIKYSELVQTAELSGNYTYQGGVISATSADISAKGQSFDATFTGSATLAETPVFDGSLEFNAEDVAALAKALDLDVKGLDLISSAAVTADLTAQDKGFRGENVKANIKGDGLDADFTGALTYADTISAAGTFNAKAASVPAIINALELDLPQAGAVEEVTVSGAVDYSGARTALSNLDITTKGGPVSGSYTGSATLAETVGFSGNFTAQMTALDTLSARTGIDVPYADAIGEIDVSGAVSGQGETLSVTGLSATLKDGLLNGNYTGSASLNNGVNLDGQLQADIPSLRKLAEATGTTALPPSTSAGEIYEAFSVSGIVKGTPEAITFTNANITFDAIKATGDFVVDMAKTKPFVNAALDLDGLDLNPYMAAYSAQNPTGQIQPWSTEPINFAALNAVDGDFKLNTPNIKTARISIGQSDITAQLRAGVLTADLPNMALYGGTGRMVAEVNAANAVPTVSFDMGLKDLGAQGFLGAVAGFTQATGETGTSLKVSGRGRSQAEIMKSLTGEGDFKMIDGTISGVNIEELMSGLDQAFASRSLPGGIGTDQITKFKDIVGLFEIENGVAKLNTFSLKGFGVLAEGGGAIDLGSQNLDFSLRPRLTGKSASDLAAFGIPIRVQGGFGNLKVGLDTKLVEQIIAERARAEAGSLIEREVGGALGGVLSDVIGGKTTEPATPPTDVPTAETPATGTAPTDAAPDTPAPEAEPVTPAPTPAPELKDQVEDKAEEAVNDLLSDIFKTKKE